MSSSKLFVLLNFTLVRTSWLQNNNTNSSIITKRLCKAKSKVKQWQQTSLFQLQLLRYPPCVSTTKLHCALVKVVAFDVVLTSLSQSANNHFVEDSETVDIFPD